MARWMIIAWDMMCIMMSLFFLILIVRARRRSALPSFSLPHLSRSPLRTAFKRSNKDAGGEGLSSVMVELAPLDSSDPSSRQKIASKVKGLQLGRGDPAYERTLDLLIRAAGLNPVNYTSVHTKTHIVMCVNDSLSTREAEKWFTDAFELTL